MWPRVGHGAVLCAGVPHFKELDLTGNKVGSLGPAHGRELLQIFCEVLQARHYLANFSTVKCTNQSLDVGVGKHLFLLKVAREAVLSILVYMADC